MHFWPGYMVRSARNKNLRAKQALQSNLSQNKGNPVVKGGCYWNFFTIKHLPHPLVFFSSVCYTSLLTSELS